MIKNLVKHGKQDLARLYILLLFLIAFVGCQPLDRKKDHFSLKPVLNKVYNYSLTKTSEQHSLGKLLFDTVQLNFSMENIHTTDKAIIYKLTFNDFILKRHPINIKFRNNSFSENVMQRNPFAILDSLGYFLHGKSVQVVINNKGVVEEVYGIDTLIERISKASNTDIASVKNLTSDYISSNVIKDFLNRIFTVVPDQKVNEDDKWVRNIMLITKAPVKLSNLYTLEQRSRDTAYVSIQSIVSAALSEGGTVYMKGKQTGNAIVSYSTGMPYLYETNAETVTTTDQYDVKNVEHFIVKLN